MMKMLSFLAKSCSLKPRKILLAFIVWGIFAFDPCVSQAKADDGQNEIILLNDSAAALEDSSPDLSRKLTELADEKEKEWEYRSANKDALPAPVTDKDIPRLQDQIKLLKASVVLIQPTYPLIAQGLDKMARDINKTIEINGINEK